MPLHNIGRTIKLRLPPFWSSSTVVVHMVGRYRCAKFQMGVWRWMRRIRPLVVIGLRDVLTIVGNDVLASENFLPEVPLSGVWTLECT